MRFPFLFAVFLAMPLAAAEPTPEPVDPYLWLEEVAGERQLAWVRARNAKAVAAVAKNESFEALEQRLLAILDSQEKIPYVRKIGDR